MKTLSCVLLVVGVVLFSASADAHHSFSAEFDLNKPVKLTGTITMVRWANPHAWIYMDVKGDDGKVVNWAWETSAANQLYRNGWRTTDLKFGMVVTIEGWLARNGTPTANAGTVLLPDGRKLGASAQQLPAAGPATDSVPAGR